MDDTKVEIRVCNHPDTELSWYFRWANLRCHVTRLPKHETFPDGNKLLKIKSYRHNFLWIFWDFINSDGAEFEVDRYDKDNKDKTQIYAEAWVLSDVLNSNGFKAEALRKMYEMYLGDKEEFPGGDEDRDIEIGPGLVRYCFVSTPGGSTLRELITEILIHYSDDRNVVDVTNGMKSEWDKVWTEFPALGHRLLLRLAEETEIRRISVPGFDVFLNHDDRGG